MKILCILYDDPKSGMPSSYARDDLPKIEKYPDGSMVVMVICGVLIGL